MVLAMAGPGYAHAGPGAGTATAASNVKPGPSATSALAPDLASNPPPTWPKLNPALPGIFIAGDSTAARGAGENQQGWAVPFADYFDPAKVNIVNLARGGRSSRTFITEGLWDQSAGRGEVR